LDIFSVLEIARKKTVASLAKHCEVLFRSLRVYKDYFWHLTIWFWIPG